MLICGNYIANCTIGIAVGVGPGGTTNNTATGGAILGNWFKNNSTAITGAGNILSGNRIEGANGAAPGGANPQYGINNISFGLYAGMIITGAYDKAGFNITNSGINSEFTVVNGVEVTNSSGTGGAQAWELSFGTAQYAPQFQACNTEPIFDVSQLPVWVASVTGSWLPHAITAVTSLVGGSGYVPGNYPSVPLTGGSGTGAIGNVTVNSSGVVSGAFVFPPSGSNYAVNDVLSASNTNLGGSGSGFSITVASVADTAMLTLSNSGPTGNLNSYNGGIQITVSGMTPSGYDGTFLGTPVGFNQLIYTVPGPLGNGTGGTGVAYGVANGTATVLDADTYTVNDGTNGLTWSALLTNTGTHTTHSKARFNGTQFSVVGQ